MMRAMTTVGPLHGSSCHCRPGVQELQQHVHTMIRRRTGERWVGRPTRRNLSPSFLGIISIGSLDPKMASMPPLALQMCSECLAAALPDQAAEGISAAAHEASTSGRAPVIAVCGAKGTGKSTLGRLLANALLDWADEVAWLDTDPGQPEFTVPGGRCQLATGGPMLGHALTFLDGRVEIQQSEPIFDQQASNSTQC